MEKKFTNRKKAEDGSKVSWLDTKERKFVLDFHATKPGPFTEVNLKKTLRSVTSTPLTIRDMDLLWPTRKPISEAKLTDLKSIMHLIPRDAQNFYETLKSTDNIIEDDIDGFTGALNFEVEENDTQ